MRIRARASSPFAAMIASIDEPSFVATAETVSPDFTT